MEPWSICDGDFENWIRCYEDDCLGLVEFSALDCLHTETNDLELEQDPHIYPNPAYNVINVNIPYTVSIERMDIIDHRGQRIASIRGNQQQIDISWLEPGIYFLNVMIGKGGSIIRKFIKY